jgi:hypothetical protein
MGEVGLAQVDVDIYGLKVLEKGEKDWRDASWAVLAASQTRDEHRPKSNHSRTDILSIANFFDANVLDCREVDLQDILINAISGINSKMR